MEGPHPRLHRNPRKQHKTTHCCTCAFVPGETGAWGGNLAGNRLLPDTATGGQGGISVGLVPIGVEKSRRGLKMHEFIAARQVAEMSKKGEKKKEKSQMDNTVKKENMSKGLRHLDSFSPCHCVGGTCSVDSPFDFFQVQHKI